jgi:hypothetical protein
MAKLSLYPLSIEIIGRSPSPDLRRNPFVCLEEFWEASVYQNIWHIVVYNERICHNVPAK